MKIKTYNDFLLEKKMEAFVEIAKRNHMSEDCMQLVVWWGLTGYLYYHSLPDKNPPITNEGRKMLKALFDSVINGTYNDSANSHQSSRDDYDPIVCEENVYKQLGKNYIDDTFNANLIELKHPMKVFKDYSAKRFVTGKDTAWYSFSVIKGRDQNTYGDAYICYELPAGFKYLDTRGLAEKGEVLINGKDLTDDMIIKNANEMKIDLKKGDEILTGKWQNKHDEVRTVGKNELGQPTVNGKPMLKFRVKRLMPKKKKTNESVASFENFLAEEDAYYAAHRKVLYRNTSMKWLMDLLKKGSAAPYMSKKRFISFSKKEDSGGQDTFGDIRIVFDATKLYAQGAIEIEYDNEFFEEHPDISMYVTSYKGEEDYYKNSGYKGKEDFEENGQDDADTLMWSTLLDDYAEEAEIVLKNLKLEKGLILSVVVPKKLKGTSFDKEIKEIQTKGINVELE